MKRILFAALVLAAAGRTASAQADGKALYAENCAKCHGPKGVPPQTMQKKFERIAMFDAAFLTKHTVDSITKVITKGKNEDMVSFKDKLKAEELAAVAKYVHDLAGQSK